MVLFSIFPNTHDKLLDFPGGSDGKGSACNAGDPGSPGEMNDYPYPSILDWRIPWPEEPAVHGVTKSQT